MAGGTDPAITYGREYLLKFQHTSTPAFVSDIDWTDSTLKTSMKWKKKRGSRGGIRNRLKKRGCRLPLPAITLSNVRTLPNKMAELSTLSKHDGDFRRGSLYCFTETWLTEDNTGIELDGFTTIRFDRDSKSTEKHVGGGLCMFVNKRWATNFTVRETISTRHFEILTVSFRPHYLPREFGQITVILAYVPGPNNVLAAERIAECYNTALSRSIDQPVFLLGDFNTCDVHIKNQLPTLRQYVTCSTRFNSRPDKCYGNIPDAYVSFSRPPLGRSDHKVIHLLPRYRQKLKRETPVTRGIQMWTKENVEQLRGCFEATNWNIFFDSCGLDLELLTNTITFYIQFCQNTVVEYKNVRIFPNNKPWIRKDLKHCLNEKKVAFLKGDKQRVKELEKEFSIKVKKAKLEYRDKIQEKFIRGNAKDAWDGLNLMMGRKQKKQTVQGADSAAFANELNQFYARFDVHDFKSECEQLCDTLTPSHVNVQEKEVVECLSKMNSSKASGPDGVEGKILKMCSHQLGNMFSRLFQLFLNMQFTPKVWKSSMITPVPKKTNARLLNDFRPVCLTSVLCKCMERIVCKQLVASVADRMDPLQFAYKARRGVDDATLTLLDTVTRHLDKSGTCVRILFMDFSSAFNTIQHHILLGRLRDLGVNSSVILWIRAFLCDRPQRVKVGHHISNEIVVNTGAPQGCVLSPVLFSIYTNEIMYNNPIITLIKFADDMALVARLKDELSLSQYYLFVRELTAWCDRSSLELNVQKTKEMCIGARRVKDKSVFKPLLINGQDVEQVSHFKYLGTILDQQLSFSENVDYICKKAHQRLYMLRKLRSFNVNKSVLQLVYKSLIESILSFNLVSYYGNLTVKYKAKLTRIVKLAAKISGSELSTLSDIHTKFIRRKTNRILKDKTHPLCPLFEILPSGRRFKVPLARKNTFKRSFIPSAIAILNS